MKMTALYERISREDRNEGESFSILRQKEYLETYAAANGFENCRHYTDDGFSGRNFERPGWQQMMTDIVSGKIGGSGQRHEPRRRVIPCKRFLYRNPFKEKDVRFIATDSHVDNSCSDSLSLRPC
ncbi:MAG: recombinase family protein [Christensenellales bacterium]